MEQSTERVRDHSVVCKPVPRRVILPDIIAQPSWTCYSPPVFLCPAVYCSELTLSLTQPLLIEFRFTQAFIRINFGFPALPKEDSSAFREQLTLHCSALVMAQLPTAQCRTSHLCHSKKVPNTHYHSHMDQVIRSSSAWKNLDNCPSPSGQGRVSPPGLHTHLTYKLVCRCTAGAVECTVWTWDGSCHFPSTAQRAGTVRTGAQAISSGVQTSSSPCALKVCTDVIL